MSSTFRSFFKSGSEIIHPSPRHLRRLPMCPGKCAVFSPTRARGCLDHRLDADADHRRLGGRAVPYIPSVAMPAASHRVAFAECLLQYVADSQMGHRCQLEHHVIAMDYDDDAFMPELQRTTSIDLSPALRRFDPRKRLHALHFVFALFVTCAIFTSHCAGVFRLAVLL